ncbi:hypothetical protein A2U01_0003325, partial [Trifolium medium]|nr:hypothetical protein [Trifolium medium]
MTTNGEGQAMLGGQKNQRRLTTKHWYDVNLSQLVPYSNDSHLKGRNIYRTSGELLNRRATQTQTAAMATIDSIA